MKNGEHHQEKKGENWLIKMGEILKGGVLAVSTALLLLFVFAALISVGVVGEKWLNTLSMIGCAVGGFVGGACVIRKDPDRTLLKGFAIGVVMYLILMTLGVIIYGAVSLERGGGLLMSAVCGGILSSVMVRGRKKRKRKNRG